MSAMLSGALVGALGWALVIGLGVELPDVAADALKTFTVAPPAPPPEPVTIPERTRTRRPEGAAAARDIRSRATAVVAPVPVAPPPVPSPVIAAPVAGVGSDASAGAAELPGPGTGAGGAGTGSGSGGGGDGDGGGYADETPPQRIRGRIRDSDYPEAAADLGAGGTVSVRYFVEVTGRVSGCRVARSSGNAELDEATCRLIERRFRYDPSRDADGRPVRSIVLVDHEWVLEREPLAARD